METVSALRILLWVKFIGHRNNFLKKILNFKYFELRCFFFCSLEYTIKQTVESPVIQVAVTPMRPCSIKISQFDKKVQKSHHFAVHRRYTQHVQINTHIICALFLAVTSCSSTVPMFSGEAALPWLQGSWGQRGAHLGPTGPRWATCWPHEPCYLGIPIRQCSNPEY